MITIDGSQGEGGGQILRTSLALSLVTGQPFNGDAFNPAFASDMRRFIAETGPRLWVHGHLHSPSDYMVGSTRVLANPRGYPTESRKGFNPGLVMEV